MRTDANNSHAAPADERAVAIALNGVVVRGERNLLAESAALGLAGARAALETFYYAFNTRSVELYEQIWANDPLVQLFSPVGGLVRGHAGIAALSARMFSESAVRIQTVLDDLVAYVTAELVVFTGRERGTYTHTDTPGGEHEAHSNFSEGRSICVFRFIAEQGGWRQVYHHVSLDDADQLARFQGAAHGT